MILVGLFDDVSNTLLDVHTESSEIVAVRNFNSALQLAFVRKDGVLYTNPEDFRLVLLGTFDDFDFALTALDSPRTLFAASKDFARQLLNRLDSEVDADV